jgi:hypothetical protein
MIKFNRHYCQPKPPPPPPLMLLFFHKRVPLPWELIIPLVEIQIVFLP